MTIQGEGADNNNSGAENQSNAGPVATPPPWADLPAYRAEYRGRNPLPPLDQVLPDLAKRRQWVLWRYEPGESPEKKPRKMPYYANGRIRGGGDQGSEKDRSALVTFATAATKFCRAAGTEHEYDGVGFAFLPNDGLVGIDLDGMIDPESGEVSERGAGILAACASYSEYSPSGTGVHIICAEDEKTFEGVKRKTFKSNKIGVEVFTGKQFFTFTARAWPGAPFELRPLSNKVAHRLYEIVEEAKGRAPAAASEAPAATPPRAPAGGRQRSVAENVALVEEALAFIDPDEDYLEGWIYVGMACKAELGTAGFMVWDAWSARGAKYVSSDMGQRWNTFDAKAQIGVNYIFKLAQGKGWVPPWEKAKRKARPSRATESVPTPSEAPAGGGEGAPPPSPPVQYPPVGGPPDCPPDDDWELGLIEKKGEISSCLANAELILANAREWHGVIAYDEFGERTVFRKPLPFAKSGKKSGDWTDDLDIKATIWLQRAFRVEFAKNNVGQAVESVARDNRFHPVREALRALPPWDGKRRLATWMVDYLGVRPDTDLEREYIALVGTYFLRGMIQRVMRPGSKFDYCPVLEGDQGKGKSSAARVLSWHWFADTDLDLTSKDSLLALPGTWVYEIAELGSLMRAEERKQKSFLSRQTDEYRPPYASRMIEVPRQNVFIGTTNEEEYLKDATGARRFWPVMCAEAIDLDGLMAVRELLYAEALHDFDAGERAYPSKDEEKRLFVPEQAKRGMQEPFEDILHTWVKAQPAPFSMAEAAQDGLKLTADKLTPAVVTRIGIALRKLGCGRKEERLAADPGQRRLYLPPHMMEQKGIGTGHAKGGAGYADF